MDRVVRGSCTGDQIICTPPIDDITGRCDPAAGCVYEPAAVSPDRLPVTLPAEMITGRPLLTRQPTPVPEEPGPAVEGPCDDGNACTTDDMIMDGACHGRPLICEDGDEMTADDCDPRSGCVFTRVEREPEEPGPGGEGPCDDGNACTTDDMIMDGVCHGRPLICEDGDEMTADDCDPRSGCVFTRFERKPEVPEPPVTPVVVEVVTTVVPVQCPEGCSCLTQDEAKELFRRFLPCSDTPCGALVSRTGTIPRYCLRPAG
jgi:hypothetical protein